MNKYTKSKKMPLNSKSKKHFQIKKTNTSPAIFIALFLTNLRAKCTRFQQTQPWSEYNEPN
tara:strand:- start:307 stop:489 length:183 start_codon:yes stop_codon:yes gene_type:complete